MPAVKYSDTLVAIFNNILGKYYFTPATNISISLQNKLEPSRILAPNQNNNLRIGGERVFKVSMSFLACRKTSDIDPSSTWNLASGVLNDLTGINTPVGINISNQAALSGYLDSMSLQIQPFAPITVSADFTCLVPANVIYAPGINSWDDDSLVSGFAHGYNTVITNGTTLSETSRDSITYKITCDRSYTTSIGQTVPDNVFLNGIEKELNIKSTNIISFINHSGYGEMVTIDPRNDLGESIVGGGFGMSSNCRIVSQNLSLQEGGILAGDISLREVIL